MIPARNLKEIVKISDFFDFCCLSDESVEVTRRKINSDTWIPPNFLKR